MKQFRIISLSALMLLFAFTNCSKKCDNENPRARIFNLGTKDAKVQIKTSGGNTENLNNVAPGTVSEYRSYAAGLIEFTISVSNVDYKKVVVMGNCFEYDIAIDANNNITAVGRDRND
jgi:hypothetical protein